MRKRCGEESVSRRVGIADGCEAADGTDCSPRNCWWISDSKARMAAL